MVWRWDFSSPFGEDQPDERPSGLEKFVYNPRFPGQIYDIETSTHYNYFRDYDPQIGRYIQSDSLGLLGGINTYTYVGNDSINKFDPTGEFALVPVVVGGIIGGISGAYGAKVTGGNVWKGAFFGATVGAVVGAAAPVVAGSVLGNVALRAAIGGIGNAVGQMQNVGNPCLAGPNWGSFLGSIVGGGLSGVVAPGGWGSSFSGSFGSQLVQRALSGMPGMSLSSTAGIVGTASGNLSKKCGCQ